jgi:hypothetical protein
VKQMCLLPAVVAEIRWCLVFGEKFNDRAVLLCHDGCGWWKGLVIIGDEIYSPVKDDSIVQYCESYGLFSSASILWEVSTANLGRASPWLLLGHRPPSVILRCRRSSFHKSPRSRHQSRSDPTTERHIYLYRALSFYPEPSPATCPSSPPHSPKILSSSLSLHPGGLRPSFPMTDGLASESPSLRKTRLWGERVVSRLYANTNTVNENKRRDISRLVGGALEDANRTVASASAARAVLLPGVARADATARWRNAEIGGRRRRRRLAGVRSSVRIGGRTLGCGVRLHVRLVF